jgi:hypothetical protein
MKLSDVIADIEANAASHEHQSKHGSSMTTMAEDAAALHTAKLLRKMAETLKQVDEL